MKKCIGIIDTTWKSVTKIRNAGRIFYKLEKAAILYLLKQLYFMDTFIYQILPS